MRQTASRVIRRSFARSPVFLMCFVAVKLAQIRSHADHAVGPSLRGINQPNMTMPDSAHRTDETTKTDRSSTKDFAYLIQCKNPRPTDRRLQPNRERDVLWFSWNSETTSTYITENGAIVHRQPNTTHTEGRNIVLRHAIGHAIEFHGSASYLYYAFMDH